MEIFRTVAPHIGRAIDSRMDACREHFWGVDDDESAVGAPVPQLPPDVHTIIASKLSTVRALAGYASASKFTRAAAMNAPDAGILRGAGFLQRTLQLHEKQCAPGARTKAVDRLLSYTRSDGGVLSNRQRLRLLDAEMNRPGRLCADPKKIAPLLNGCPRPVKREILTWAQSLENPYHRRTMLGGLAAHGHNLTAAERADLADAAFTAPITPAHLAAIPGFVKNPALLSEDRQLQIIDALFDFDPHENPALHEFLPHSFGHIDRRAMDMGPKYRHPALKKIASRIHLFSKTAQERFWELCEPALAAQVHKVHEEGSGAAAHVFTEILSEFAKSISGISHDGQLAIAKTIESMPFDSLPKIAGSFGPRLNECSPAFQARFLEHLTSAPPKTICETINSSLISYLADAPVATKRAVFTAATDRSDDREYLLADPGKIVKAFAPIAHALPEDLQADFAAEKAACRTHAQKTDALSGSFRSHAAIRDADFEALHAHLQRGENAIVAYVISNAASAVPHYAPAAQVKIIDAAAAIANDDHRRIALRALIHSFAGMAPAAQLRVLNAIGPQLADPDYKSLQTVAKAIVHADDHVQRCFFSILAEVKDPGAVGNALRKIVPTLNDAPEAEFRRIMSNLPKEKAEAWAPWLKRQAMHYIFTDPTIMFPLVAMLESRQPQSRVRMIMDLIATQ